MQIAVLAGENSGDLHAAALVRALRRRLPGARFWGIGGAHLRAAGVHLEYESTDWSALGFFAALPRVVTITSAFEAVREMITSRRPDLLIPVDFGTFNVPMAHSARAVGTKVFYYFPPKSWSRRAHAGDLPRVTDRIVTPFPWNAEMLRAAGADAHWVGHPLLDLCAPGRTREQFFRDHRLDPERPLLCHLPGSRRFELRCIGRRMAAAGALLRQRVPGLQHVVARAPSLPEAEVRARFEGVPDLVITDAAWDALNAADAALCKSGSVTLEAALFAKPMLVLYDVPAAGYLQYMLFHWGRLPMIGMPNILAQKKICPELIGPYGSPEAIAGHVLPWLREPETADPMREELRHVAALLGEPGAVERAADLAADLLR